MVISFSHTLPTSQLWVLEEIHGLLCLSCLICKMGITKRIFLPAVHDLNGTCLKQFSQSKPRRGEPLSPALCPHTGRWRQPAAGTWCPATSPQDWAPGQSMTTCNWTFLPKEQNWHLAVGAELCIQSEYVLFSSAVF